MLYAGFSALQRAEIAEIVSALSVCVSTSIGFSALQRAEIAEIVTALNKQKPRQRWVSVLFNEPKLLKSECRCSAACKRCRCFSALQRAEIAEIFTRQ